MLHSTKKEAEKCNAATVICESARERERAQELFLKEKKVTSLWERRAWQLGWKDVEKHENVGRGTSAEKRQNWRSQKRNKVDIMQHMIAPVP